MPSELMIHIEEYNRRKEINSDEAFALAYYNAAWHRMKRMPKLEKLMKDRENARKEQQRQKRPQTAEDMLAMAMRLNAKNGGLTKGGGTEWQ